MATNYDSFFAEEESKILGKNSKSKNTTSNNYDSFFAEEEKKILKSKSSSDKSKLTKTTKTSDASNKKQIKVMSSDENYKATIDATKKDPKNPILKTIKDVTIDPYAKGMSYLQNKTKIGRVVSKIAQSAGKTAGGPVVVETTLKSKLANKTAEKVGNVLGFGFNPSGVGTGISAINSLYDMTANLGTKTASKVSSNVASKVLSKTGNEKLAKVAQNVVAKGTKEAIRQAPIGAVGNVMNSVLNGNTSGSELASSAISGYVGGAGFGGVAGSLGGALAKKKLPNVGESLKGSKNPNAPKLSDALKTVQELENAKKAVSSIESKLTKASEKAKTTGNTTQSQRHIESLQNSLKQNQEIINKNQSTIDNLDLNKMNLDTENIDLTPKNSDALSKIALNGVNSENFKNRWGAGQYTTDLVRNISRTFGEKAPQVKTLTVDMLNKAKGESVKFQRNVLNDLNENVVKGLGIKKNSEISADVQNYGEGLISIDNLKAKYPDKWEDIVKADEWFRNFYDTVIGRINETRKMLYPNNPDKLIQTRKDYYRHLQEITTGGPIQLFKSIRNILKADQNIDPSLEGISEFLVPKSKYASIAQKRENGPYNPDAVAGILNYLPQAAQAIHLDPFIGLFEKMGNNLATLGKETNLPVNSTVDYMKTFAQDLAGKTNPVMDRLVIKLFGRKPVAITNLLSSQLRKSQVMGNIGSALSQLANIPNGIASAKQYSLAGAKRTMQDIADYYRGKPTVADESALLNERFLGEKFASFENGVFKNADKAAGYLMSSADKIGTRFIWNSLYEKGLALGEKNPIQYADDQTLLAIGGRGVGETPIAYKSNFINLALPFQLEVNNTMRKIGDFRREQDLSGFITMMVASHMLNKGYETVMGRSIGPDMFKDIEDASKDGLTPVERGGRIVGGILSNTPGGQYVGSIYPQYGTKFPFTDYKLPTREKIFGQNDPTRFGTGLPIVNALQNPKNSIYALLPTGGMQVRKTVEGYKALKKGYVENDGKLSYPIERTPSNIAKSLLFGPTATKEAQSYFDLNTTPFGKKQTKELLSSNNLKSAYVNKMIERKLKPINAELNKIYDEIPLTTENGQFVQKPNANQQKKIKELQSKLEKVKNEISQSFYK